MFEKIRTMFSIQELRKKILLTLGLIAVYRLGWNIMLPMVNDQGTLTASAGLSDLLSKVAVFSGTQLDNMTIFGLGIMPYISASIIFQLLATVWEPLERLQKEGESGRKKINEYTRYATVLICIIQSMAYIAMWDTTAMNQMSSSGAQDVFLSSCVSPTGKLTFGWWAVAILIMTTGTAFLMWLGEQIDEYGIGNGISLLIMAGILARAPGSIKELYTQASSDGGLKLGGQLGFESLFFLVVMFIVVVLAVVFVMKGQRRIPTQSAKHVRGRQVFGGNRQYLPLRVNQAGVMPIIFASSLMMFPQFIFMWMKTNFTADGSIMGAIGQAGDSVFGDSTSFWRIIIEVLFIYFFCYFWTAVTFKPTDLADNLKDSGTFIQGYRPGSRTADYLDNVVRRITYVGASFLAVIAIVPTIIIAVMQIPYGLATFFGGTSLLIAVSVVMDLVDKIDGHLVMRNYKRLLDK